MKEKIITTILTILVIALPMAIMRWKIRRILQYMCRKPLIVSVRPWRLFRYSFSDIMLQLREDLMWINQEIWQRV